MPEKAEISVQAIGSRQAFFAEHVGATCTWRALPCIGMRRVNPRVCVMGSHAGNCLS